MLTNSCNRIKNLLKAVFSYEKTAFIFCKYSDVKKYFEKKLTKYSTRDKI